MKTVLLVSDQELDSPRAHPCRLRDRLRARVCALSLDRALAAGVSPDSTVLLSLRAEELIRMSKRNALAGALRRVVVEARRPLQPLGPIPLARRAILHHDRLIQELAAVIDRPGPVDVRGLAATEVLLKDGSGPLYVDCRGDSLGRRLEEVLAIFPAPPADFTVA